jgi:hypothetical protein
VPGDADCVHRRDGVDAGDSDLRSIDPAAAAHLARLFARAKHFCREAHIAGALALTGPDPLGVDDLASLEQSSRDQDGYFDRFLQEMLVAPPESLEGSRVFGIALSNPQAIARFGLFGRDIWGRVLNWLRQKFRRKPLAPDVVAIQEMRQLDDNARHCSECPEEADKGWQVLGSLKGIGGCECAGNDRCSFRYREVLSDGTTRDLDSPVPAESGSRCGPDSPVVSKRRLPGSGGGGSAPSKAPAGGGSKEPEPAKAAEAPKAAEPAKPAAEAKPADYGKASEKEIADAWAKSMPGQDRTGSMSPSEPGPAA